MVNRTGRFRKIRTEIANFWTFLHQLAARRGRLGRKEGFPVAVRSLTIHITHCTLHWGVEV
jgi:hypothetical protein